MVKEVGKVYHAQVITQTMACIKINIYIYIHVEHYSRLDGLAFRDVSLFSLAPKMPIFVKVWKNPSPSLFRFSLLRVCSDISLGWLNFGGTFWSKKLGPRRLSQNSPDSRPAGHFHTSLSDFPTSPQHSTIPLGLECGAPLAGRAALTWKVLVAVHPANLWNNMCQGVFRWAQGQNHLDFFHVFTTITGDDEMMLCHFKTGWEYYFDNSKSHDILMSKYLWSYCLNRIEHELFARCFGQNIQILLRSLLLQKTAPSDH